MISKIKILLAAFVLVVLVVHAATGQTLPNAQVWGNTLLSAKTENSDTSGNISISQLNNALYYNINNVVNVPVTNRIIYSNGTNLTSNSGLTYSGSSFGVTGTGVFTSTVSGANASSASHFTTLSQLQAAVSGTTNFVPKFTATNTIGNSLIQDDGDRIKLSGKPTLNEFATNRTKYTDIHTSAYPGAATTGAYVIELPFGWNNIMQTFTIGGYNYSATTANWQITFGGYNATASGGNWSNYGIVDAVGLPPFDNIRLAYNATTAKCVIILGETTTVWQYGSIRVKEWTGDFTTSNNYATGWSSSWVTDLSGYSKVKIAAVKENLKKHNEISTGLNIYRDVATYTTNASITGALVFELPVVSAVQMQKYRISGYTYTSGAGWELHTGVYYSSNSSSNYNAEATGNPPFSSVSYGYNATTGRYVLILGTVSTVWSFPKVVISELVSGYITTNELYTPWTVSVVTSLAAYSSINTTTVQTTAKKESANTFTAAQTAPNFISNVATGTQPYATTSTTLNTNLNADLLDGQSGAFYQSATNINAGTLADARLSANVALGNINNNFSVNQTVPNATADGHALNRITADGRFLGITATATNSNALRGLDTNVIAQRNQLNDFTQRNRFFGITSFSGSVFFNNAADYTPYNEDTDKIFVMKGDGELRSKNIRDIINDISVNDTFALTGNTGGVFNLSSYATTVIDLGLYTSTMGTGNVLEFRLASGGTYYNNQQITVTASGQIICGQGSKIRLANNSGTTLVQACNDVLGVLTEPYEFSENPLRNFSIVFQYSKKRNLWRIVNFKNFADL